MNNFVIMLSCIYFTVKLYSPETQIKCLIYILSIEVKRYNVEIQCRDTKVTNICIWQNDNKTMPPAFFGKKMCR